MPRVRFKGYRCHESSNRSLATATLRHWPRGRKMTYLNMALSAFTPGTIVPTLSLKTDRGARKDRLPASLSNSTMLTLSVDDCPFGSGEASALPTTRELWAPRKQIGIGTRLETHARGKRADSVVRLTESEGATLKRGTIVTAAGPISIRWTMARITSRLLFHSVFSMWGPRDAASSSSWFDKSCSCCWRLRLSGFQIQSHRLSNHLSH